MNIISLYLSLPNQIIATGGC